MDRRSGWKLDGPWTAAPGVTDDGERIGSGNPIGVHHAGEHVAACSASHWNARQRAHAERSFDVLGPEQHGHVARSGNRQDPRVFQLEIARIAALRTTEECGVGLALPARAIDEALTIGCEPGGRHDTPAERHRVETWRWPVSGHIDGTVAANTAAVSAAPATAPQRAARRGRRVMPGAAVVVPEPASAIHRNSAARSRAVCQRSSGSFARQRRISRSSEAGACGCSDDSGGGSAADDGRHQRGAAVARERSASAHHLVEDDAEREDVGARVHLPSFDLLWRHVGNRPDDDAGLGQPLAPGRFNQRLPRRVPSTWPGRSREASRCRASA